LRHDNAAAAFFTNAITHGYQRHIRGNVARNAEFMQRAYHVGTPHAGTRHGKCSRKHFFSSLQELHAKGGERGHMLTALKSSKKIGIKKTTFF